VIAEWRSPDGSGSMFASDGERREPWDQRRDAIMADYVRPPTSLAARGAGGTTTPDAHKI
jgi:hypothetical protein